MYVHNVLTSTLTTTPNQKTNHGNEMLHKILHIEYTDTFANEEFYAKIQQPHEDLTFIRRCKLQWSGHISY